CTISSQNTFSAPVDLTCSNLPAGVTCAFSATPVTPPSNGAVISTLTISTTTDTPPGFALLQVVGTSGALTRAARVSISVVVPSFGIACTPNSVSVQQGNSVTSRCQITSVNNFSGLVAFSCAALPAGASCSFDPPEVFVPPAGLAASTFTLGTSSATP